MLLNLPFHFAIAGLIKKIKGLFQFEFIPHALQVVTLIATSTPNIPKRIIKLIARKNITIINNKQ